MRRKALANTTMRGRRTELHWMRVDRSFAGLGLQRPDRSAVPAFLVPAFLVPAFLVRGVLEPHRDRPGPVVAGDRRADRRRRHDAAGGRRREDLVRPVERRTWKRARPRR